MTKKITKLMLNGQEYEIREYQQGWQPGANTVLYFPFKTDQSDKVGNTTIDTVGTQQTLGYNFSSSGEMKLVSAPTTMCFLSAWVKYNGYTNSVTQFGGAYVGFMLYNFRHAENSSYDKVFQAATGPASYIKSTAQNTTTGTRYHMAMGYDGTYSYGYLNGQLVWTGSGGGYTGNSYVRFGYGIDMTVSEYIGESVCRTAQEVSDYYNQTKDQYPSSEPQIEPCHVCGGTGEEECDMCGGTGQEMCPTCSGAGQIGDPEDLESRTTCPDCDGGGFISCGICDGTGMVTCSNCGGTGEEPGE